MTHSSVLRSNDYMVAAVKDLLDSGQYDASAKSVDRDEFYLILRDPNDSFTDDQKLDMLSLFFKHRGGSVFNNGRAMFEVLWRLSSYRRTWVPIVASLLSANAWQEFATILIKYDKVPQDHYPRLVCMCLLFGAWALLDDDREYLEQEWQKHIDKLGISEPWQPVCIEDVTENISAARHIALVEAYSRVSLHFVSRDIRDLLCQDPTRTNVEIAQQALNGCLDVGSNYRFDAFVDLETAMALVCRARQMVEKKYKLHLVAELTAIY